MNPPNLLKKAKAQNSCPRLVQKKVDRTQILRHDTLATDSCDYFIYPNIGDTVEVSVSDRRIELKLTRSDWHDFDNGGFMVTKNGRHVIRLQYDAFGSRPPIMDYVIKLISFHLKMSIKKWSKTDFRPFLSICPNYCSVQRFWLSLMTSLAVLASKKPSTTVEPGFFRSL